MLAVSKGTLSPELLALTQTLAEEYPICFEETGKHLIFEKTESADCCFSCQINGDSITIRYSCISAAASWPSFAAC